MITGGFAAKSTATSAIYGRRTTRNTLFNIQKEIRRGEISKKQRVFLVGRVPALLEQGAVLELRLRDLAVSLKIGSSLVVQGHHFCFCDKSRSYLLLRLVKYPGK